MINFVVFVIFVLLFNFVCIILVLNWVGVNVKLWYFVLIFLIKIGFVVDIFLFRMIYFGLFVILIILYKYLI